MARTGEDGEGSCELASTTRNEREGWLAAPGPGRGWRELVPRTTLLL